MRVRMFVLEYAVPRVQYGARVHLLVDGRFSPATTRVEDMQPAPEALAPALLGPKSEKEEGILKYYVADALIPNDGTLHDGMTGTAKITVQRRSVMGLIAKEVREFFDRKVW
jgi:putative peptide zinc metalloprotease protein